MSRSQDSTCVNNSWARGWSWGLQDTSERRRLRVGVLQWACWYQILVSPRQADILFSFFSPLSRPTVHISHFSPYSVFLALFLVLKCLWLIFHIFCSFVSFFYHIPGIIVCISPFSCFSMFLFHISCSKVCVSQFPRFSIFLPNSNPTVCISHFSRFLLFLAIFHVITCVSHFPRFSVFSP